MMLPARHLWPLIVLFVVATAQPGDSATRSLNDQEMRGRLLYYTAESQSGSPMSTYRGRGDMKASSQGVFCVSCHGDNGWGERETGIAAGTISWEVLSRPLASARGSVRERPAYTVASLKRLLRDGIDSFGKQIDPTMPLYALSEQQADDLVAFLKVIGTVPDPGVSDTAIRIGTVLPLKGQQASAGKIIEATLRAAFEDLNNGGGLYGRKLELVVAHLGDTPAESINSVRRFVREDAVFAVLSPYLPADDEALAEVYRTHAMPVLGPFNAAPVSNPEKLRYTFRVLAGVAEQAGALLEYARLGNASVAASLIIVSGTDSLSRRLAEAAASFARVRLTERPEVLLPAESAELQRLAEQRRKTAHAVLYAGQPHQLTSFLEAAARADWFPFVYVPGQLAPREIISAPAGFAGKIFVAYPALSADVQPAGWTELGRNAERSGGTSGTIPQLSAFASFKVLVQGLKQSGREVSRERLVRALEGLNKFDTLVTPLVSYSPSRRVGANGAYIIGVDRENTSLRQDGEWVELP